MGKKKIGVSKKNLEQVVREIEEDHPIIGITKFCKLVADRYNEFYHSNITGGIVYLRLTEYKIHPAITKPKRVNNLPANRSAVKRLTRKEKFEDLEISKILTALDKEVPREYSGTVKKLKNGSLIAAVKLKCAECSDYNKSEIKYCPIKTCGLYLFRPYK